MTWISSRNMNIATVTANISSTSKTILQSSVPSVNSYPSRVAMASASPLGAVGAGLEFNGATLRMNTGFPYTSLSALNTDHTVNFIAGKNSGLDNSVASSTFTVDLPINLGAGKFYSDGPATIKLTQTNTMAGTHVVGGGTLEISDSSHLGAIASPFTFGSGNASELSSGNLRIAGTLMTSLGARPLFTTPTKSVGFDIADAANTFTMDKLLDQTSGTFTKNGLGTLVLTQANTYTGTTTVSAGTLVINGDQSSATGNLSVAANATLGGKGTIGGNTTISTGGKLEFDISTDNLNHNKLELASAKTLAFGGSSTLTITSSGGTPAVGLYKLVTAIGGTSSITGSVPATVNLPVGWAADPPQIIVDGSDTSLVINITTVSVGGSPEIDVNQGGDITNGGSKGFGTVTLGSNAPLIFTINNTGSAALNLTGTPPDYVAVSGTNAADFTVTVQPAASVAQSSNTSFTVRFAPLGTLGGPRNAVLTIANNDGNEGTFTILVSGTAQTQYQAWAGGALFDADTNGDGVKNGLAFLLGASGPSGAVTSPTITQTGGVLKLSFNMLKPANRGTATLSVQHSSDLGIGDAWTTVLVTDTGSGPTSGVTFVVTPGGGTTNGIEATVSSSEAVAGKLFGRLLANP